MSYENGIVLQQDQDTGACCKPAGPDCRQNTAEEQCSKSFGMDSKRDTAGGLPCVSYQVIRSARKTLALQIKEDGQVIVRAPRRVSRRQIEAFVQSHTNWIGRTKERLAGRAQNRIQLTAGEREVRIQEAHRAIPERVSYFAERMGVTYGRITIREQKTRWGSCSSKGNLNFNWKLMLVPAGLLDYVVVHELAHRKEMNHSPQFWAVVEQELPDYRERRKLLKEYAL